MFAQLRALGGEAALVDDTLADIFARRFEEGMDCFYEQRPTHVAGLLRDMAAYFVQFEPLSGNLYGDLIKILGGTRKRATFVSLNYDTLLESAIIQSGLSISYAGHPLPPNTVPVLKIHGSCNFLPNVEAHIRGSSFANYNKNAAAVESRCRATQSAQEVLAFCREEDSLAPAIALYAPTKHVLYCPRFVEVQRVAWAAAVQSASRVYVIGVSVNPVDDDHVWGPLARTPAPLYYVGKPEEFIEWSTKERGKRKGSYVMANTLADAIPGLARDFGYK